MISSDVQPFVYRNSNGEKAGGWVSGEQTDNIFATNLASMKAKMVTINGKSYYAFKMRRNEELYNSAGTRLSKTAYKDRYILTEGSTSGQTHPEWLAVKYLETGVGTNQYSEIVTGGYAFVDLGYDKGSTMGSNFSLIGSI